LHHGFFQGKADAYRGHSKTLKIRTLLYFDLVGSHSTIILLFYSHVTFAATANKLQSSLSKNRCTMDEDNDAMSDDEIPLFRSQELEQEQELNQQSGIPPDHKSKDEQTSRRKKIQEIMSDQSLSQQEKNKAVQSLMDGRRRSMSSQMSSQNSSFQSFQSDESTGTGGQAQHYASFMARAAAHAHDYFSSDDDEGDAIMGDAHAPDDVVYGYNNNDRYASDESRSVASSVTHTSVQSTHSTTNAFVNNNNELPRNMTYRQIHGRSYSLQDWSDMDRAAASAAANTTIFGSAHPAQISRMMELSRPKCNHYERNCTVVSPCCGLAFGCRICHDECPVLPKPLHLRKQCNTASSEQMLAEQVYDMKHTHKSKMDRRLSMPLDLEEEEEETHHAIDRFMIREVICRSCHVRQSSKT
jgi:hypothetical protein